MSKPGGQRGEGYLREEVVDDGSRSGGGGGGVGRRCRGGRGLGSRWAGGRERGEELGGEGVPSGELAEALVPEAEERTAAAAEAGDLGVGARRDRLGGGGRGVGVEPAGDLVDEALIVADVKLLLRLRLRLRLLASAGGGGGSGHGLRRRGHGSGRARRRRAPQPRGSAHLVVVHGGRAAAGGRGGIRNFELGFGWQERRARLAENVAAECDGQSGTLQYCTRFPCPFFRLCFFFFAMTFVCTAAKSLLKKKL